MTSRDASDTRPGPGGRRTWWQFGHWYRIFTACFVVAVIALLVVRLTVARGTGLDLAVPLLQLVVATSFILQGRMRTVASPDGLTVVTFGTRTIPWSSVRSVSPDAGGHWATGAVAQLTDGSEVRLPGVRPESVPEVEALRDGAA